MHESFHPYYAFGAVRRFLFFLNGRHMRRIRIRKLVHSEVMEEFLFLNRLMLNEHELIPDDFQAKMGANWFNVSNAINIYTLFKKLDVDKNGTLSREEFINYTGSPKDNPLLLLSPLAVKRIFEVMGTSESWEMDYKAFVDFYLYMENRDSKQSKSFFWNLLNIEPEEAGGSGRLTPFIVTFFYRNIAEGLEKAGCGAPQARHVVVELNDILGCRDSAGIAYEHVMESSQGHTVMLMLLDINVFWAYDNRESLIPNEEDEVK